MIKTNHIGNGRKVGGDYFHLQLLRSSNITLEEHLNKFNTDEYYIFKATSRQRLVSKEEMIDFKYSKYIFFKKDLYDIDKILKWINWFYINKSEIKILDKHTPPFPPTKIIIRK